MVELIGRLFVAVEIPGETRHLLAGILDGLELPGRLVRPESWHLTLRFLGDTSPVAFERLCSELDQADTGTGFAVTVGGLGAFPSAPRATVLWLGVSRGGERLSQLAEIAEDAAQAVGFSPEDRPYRPHLTLSRMRPSVDVGGLVERTPPPVSFTATQVVVYRTHLGGGGARYEPMERFSLA